MTPLTSTLSGAVAGVRRGWGAQVSAVWLSAIVATCVLGGGGETGRGLGQGPTEA